MTELLEKAVSRASELPAAEQDTVAIALLKTLAQFGPKGSGTPEPRPRFGSAKGQGYMTDDFDEPLEDFKDYM